MMTMKRTYCVLRRGGDGRDHALLIEIELSNLFQIKLSIKHIYCHNLFIKNCLYT